MPKALIKKLSDETGKSNQEVERLWNKAKRIVNKHYEKKEDSEKFKIVIGILKKMLKLDENFDIGIGSVALNPQNVYSTTPENSGVFADKLFIKPLRKVALNSKEYQSRIDRYSKESK